MSIEVPKNIEDLPVVFVVDAGFNLIADVVPMFVAIWLCVVVICPLKVASPELSILKAVC